jgi:hypothetical protein
MFPPTGKNNNDLGEVSIDVVFLVGDLQENLNSLHRMVKAIASRLPENQTQIWIETPELIKLWNVPSKVLISSYNNRVFVEDGCLVFRKQNNVHYVFEQHYQIMIVCPKGQLPKVSKLIDDFRRETSSRGVVVATPSEQSGQCTRQYCNS